ncbi:unnamed protein product, partial [Tetraodon nigroviridis]
RVEEHRDAGGRLRCGRGLLFRCSNRRCPVQHRGHLHVLRREELLERVLRCHLQCLHLQSVSGVEQR